MHVRDAAGELGSHTPVMRLPIRSIATLTMAVSVATCSDTPATPGRAATNTGSHGARIAFAPVFSKSAANALARLADFGITFDHVRVVIVRPVADTVKDTTIAFAPGQSDVTLDLTVNINSDGETFNAGLDYTGPTGVVFHGAGTVQSYAAGDTPPAQQITVQYAGQGAAATRLTVSPKTATVVAPGVIPFTFAAFDANNAPVAAVPVNWTVSDATVATISNTGTLTTTGKRGTVTVTATAITGATDNGTATINLPPASIQLVSGGGQSGKVGTTLAQPGVVRLVASDGVGIPGVPVNFAAPAGGKVGSTTVTTDASGSASTSLTLGGAVGPQSFAAVAQGFSVAIAATATVGPAASIVAISGTGQTDTVKHTLKLPLVVKVTDQFGNPTPGVTVSWSRTGTGSFSSASTTTGNDGQTSIGYTLGATAGLESISASAAGIGTPVGFSETAISGTASTIVSVSGDGQNGRVLTALGAPLVVKVTDDGGNPVSGATVAWTATNGTLASPTTTTDATGASSNTMTLGGTVGNATATATAGARAVAFTATVTTGLVSKLAFITGPSAAGTGVAIAPPMQVALEDAGGNVTAATNPVTIAIGNNPGGATLSGTVTRSAVAGVATFDDLVLDRTGTGYTLVASSGNTTPATSAAFNVATGIPPHFVIQSGVDAQTATVGIAVVVAPSVQVLDATNKPMSGVSVTFTASGAGVIAPTTPVVTNTSGIATLTSWTLGRVAGAQQLVVSATGLANVTINATATAGAPVGFIVLQQPSNATAGVAVSPAVKAQLVDVFNNIATTSSATVIASITPGTGTPGAHLGGTTSQPASSGVATFSNLSIDLAGVGYRLDLTVVGSFGISSNSFDVVAGPPASIAFVTPVSTTTVGTPLSAGAYPSVVVHDGIGNAVPGASVSISTAGACTTIPGGLTLTTDATGTAALSSANLNVGVGVPQSCRLTATTSPALTTAASVVVIPVGSVAWTGAVGSNWSTAGNWSNAVVPTGTTDVFIAGSVANRPQLSSNSSVGTVKMENSGTLELSGLTLTVNGDLLASVITATPATGGILLAKNGAGSVSGGINAPMQVGANSCVGTDYALGGGVNTLGLTLNCGTLDLNGFVLGVSGQLKTQNTGTLTMTATGSSASASGGAVFDGGSETGRMTTGNLQLGNSLTIGSTSTPTTFRASGAFTLQFLSAAASISLAGSPTYTMQNLVSTASTVSLPTGGLTVNGNFQALSGSVISGSLLTVVSSVQTDASSSLTGVALVSYFGSAFPSIAGSPPAVLELDSPLALSANVNYSGNISVNQPLDLNTRSLNAKSVVITGGPTASGAFSMSGTGALVTTGPLTVNGSMPALTAGTINAGGDLTDNSGGALSSTNVTVVMTGTGASNITGTLGNLLIATGSVTATSSINVFNNFDTLVGTKFVVATGTTFFAQVVKIHSASTLTLNGNIAFEGCTRDNSASPPTINGSNGPAIAGFISSCTAGPVP